MIGGQEPILWTYVPTPLARETIASIPHRLLVYDCMDALTENPQGRLCLLRGIGKGIVTRCRPCACNRADIIGASMRLNPQTYLVPMGQLRGICG